MTVPIEIKKPSNEVKPSTHPIQQVKAVSQVVGSNLCHEGDDIEIYHGGNDTFFEGVESLDISDCVGDDCGFDGW